MKAVAIVSGGMDSVTLAHMLVDKDMYKPEDVHLIAFDYGQRHVKELTYSGYAADRLETRFSVIDLRSVTHLFKGSSLTDMSIDVPHGHYAAPTMVKTIVPNRNAIMLNIAVGVAVAEDAARVYTGVHAGDHTVYPDCRPEFIDAMNNLIPIATESLVKIEAPFVHISKAEIARIGEALGVPWDQTWSCYEGNEVHCGKCGTCVERKEALSIEGIVDPTIYGDAPWTN
jgi:7-cyano-7-deazaguanine synthase